MSWKKPAEVNVMLMGKYKNKTFEQILEEDPDYLKWYLDTTDPADVKNGGKYAKQNQARIAYIKNLFEGHGPIAVPEESSKTSAPTVGTKMIETMFKLLMQIDEKLDMLLGRKSASKEQELGPDEEVPF